MLSHLESNTSQRTPRRLFLYLFCFALLRFAALCSDAIDGVGGFTVFSRCVRFVFGVLRGEEEKSGVARRLLFQITEKGGEEDMRFRVCKIRVLVWVRCGGD